MAPKGMRDYCKHVFVATGKLEGRAMMIWFKEGDVNLVLVTVYCATEDTRADKAREIWQWVDTDAGPT